MIFDGFVLLPFGHTLTCYYDSFNVCAKHNDRTRYYEDVHSIRTSLFLIAHLFQLQFLTLFLLRFCFRFYSFAHRDRKKRAFHVCAIYMLCFGRFDIQNAFKWGERSTCNWIKCIYRFMKRIIREWNVDKCIDLKTNEFDWHSSIGDGALGKLN